MAPSLHPSNVAICILAKHKQKLTLDSSNVEMLREMSKAIEFRDLPVSVVCFGGGLRLGKSTQLGIVLQYFQNTGWNNVKWLDESVPVNQLGFQSKGGDATVTEGIWMWFPPLIIECDGKKRAIILLDAEGIDDPNQSFQMMAKIFGFAIACSSVFVYVVSERITTHDLQFFQAFADCVKHASTQINLKKQVVIRVKDYMGDQNYDEDGGRKYIQGLYTHTAAVAESRNAWNALKQFCVTGDLPLCFLTPRPDESFLAAERLNARTKFDGCRPDSHAVVGSDVDVRKRQAVGKMGEPFLRALRCFIENALNPRNMAYFSLDFRVSESEGIGNSDGYQHIAISKSDPTCQSYATGVSDGAEETVSLDHVTIGDFANFIETFWTELGAADEEFMTGFADALAELYGHKKQREYFAKYVNSMHREVANAPIAERRLNAVHDEHKLQAINGVLRNLKEWSNTAAKVRERLEHDIQKSFEQFQQENHVRLQKVFDVFQMHAQQVYQKQITTALAAHFQGIDNETFDTIIQDATTTAKDAFNRKAMENDLAVEIGLCNDGLQQLIDHIQENTRLRQLENNQKRIETTISAKQAATKILRSACNMLQLPLNSEDLHKQMEAITAKAQDSFDKSCAAIRRSNEYFERREELLGETLKHELKILILRNDDAIGNVIDDSLTKIANELKGEIQRKQLDIQQGETKPTTDADIRALKKQVHEHLQQTAENMCQTYRDTVYFSRALSSSRIDIDLAVDEYATLSDGKKMEMCKQKTDEAIDLFKKHMEENFGEGQPYRPEREAIQIVGEATKAAQKYLQNAVGVYGHDDVLLNMQPENKLAEETENLTSECAKVNNDKDPGDVAGIAAGIAAFGVGATTVGFASVTAPVAAVVVGAAIVGGGTFFAATAIAGARQLNEIPAYNRKMFSWSSEKCKSLMKRIRRKSKSKKS